MASLKEVLAALIDPWQFMSLSLSFLPSTVFNLVRTGNFSTLFSPHRLQAAWFSNFWAVAGPGVREAGEKRVVPLLEGRVKGGKIVDVAAAAAVGGTIIEVGPGSGMWVSLFSDRYLQSGSATGDSSSPLNNTGLGLGTNGEQLRQRAPSGRARVTRVLGIEPNAGAHSLLRKQVHDAGLDGIYEIVPVGIESLFSSGKVAPGSVDCIVTVLCLCSIPDPAHNIKALYACLKPGGRWVVYEHVRYQGKRSWGMLLYQGMFS